MEKRMPMAFNATRMTGGGGMTTVQTLKAVASRSLRRAVACAAMLAAAVLAQLTLVLPAHAVLEVDVTRGVVQPMPVAITDFAGVSGFQDRVFHRIELSIVDDDLDLHFWQKIDSVFTATIDLSVSFLASKSLHFRDGHTLDSNLGERLFDVFEFKRLNNGFYFLHVSVSGL